MISEPLQSLNSYSNFITELVNRPTVERSTVSVWSTSPYAGVVEGEIYFVKEFKLRLREELDFGKELIRTYGYEIYHGEEKLFWYDDFPHPNNPELTATFPYP